MRGEHCIAGASILSAMALIMLVFANIGQIKPGAVTNGLYMVELDVKAYGNAVQTANKKSAGLYQTKNTEMGQSDGLRQYYRYGLFNACGYQKDGSGICNGTIFGYPFEPLEQLVADAPTTPNSTVDYKKITRQIIPDKADTFKNNVWNRTLSRAGSLLIFVGSVLALFAFIFGLVKHRLSFFVAAVCAGVSAILLMVGAAIWTSIIAKDAWLKIVKVDSAQKVGLGIYVNAGPALYLTWVSFALIAFSVFPYVISCCTYRK